jgi:hypothetical protein
MCVCVEGARYLKPLAAIVAPCSLHVDITTPRHLVSFISVGSGCDLSQPKTDQYLCTCMRVWCWNDIIYGVVRGTYPTPVAWLLSQQLQCLSFVVSVPP